MLRNKMVLVGIGVALMLSGCGQKSVNVETTTSPEVNTKDASKETTVSQETSAEVEAETEESITLLAPADCKTTDEISENAKKAVEQSVQELNDDFGELSGKITDYQSYVDESGNVEAFYEQLVDQSNAVNLSMMEYSLRYAEIVTSSDENQEDMYDDLDGISDDIYDDACDKIYDGIYEDLFDDLDDAFYSGVLDDQPDWVEYKDWSDVRTSEYKQWSKSRTRVYKDWSNARTDIYKFSSRLRTEVYKGNREGAEERLDDFRKDIEKQKGNTGSDGTEEPVGAEDMEALSSKATEETQLQDQETSSNADSTGSADSTEALVKKVESDVENQLASLNKEWEALSGKVTSYAAYKDNEKDIEDFYEKIIDTNKALCKASAQASVDYAKLIAASGKSSSDMYSDIQGIQSDIYDGIMDDISDGIYDDLLDAMNDALYDGVLDDSDDAGVSYSEWINTKSDEYQQWLDAKSKVYSDWLETQSEIYSFEVSLSGDLFSGDEKKVEKEIADFQEDVEKM